MTTTYPIYRKGRKSGVIVKFIGIKEGYVMDQGSSGNKVGSLHKDWNPYNHPCWEPYTYTGSDITPCKTPDTLELFETTQLNQTATITKVPNGYVMTSHSGHQLFIKDTPKETL